MRMKSLKEMAIALGDIGLTQTAISIESGVTQPSISRLLNGANMSYDNGKKIEALYLRYFPRIDSARFAKPKSLQKTS